MDPILLEKVIKAVKKYEMLNSGDKILIGFSGGPDSVFLVDVLSSLKDFFNIELACIHINHLLRGDESLRDENFCREFCKARGIPLYVERIDIKSTMEEDESTEVAARRVRYQKFEEYLDRLHFNKVALAHTASDSVETFFINLLRGTGVLGLKGIPAVRDRVIRPLIFIERDEILNYLKQSGIPFVVDSSNLSLEYLRNKVRLELIPLLERIRAGSFQKIRETSEIMAEIVESLQSELDTMKSLLKIEAFNWCLLIDCTRLENYPIFMQKLFLLKEFSLTFDEFEILWNLIRSKKDGFVDKLKVVADKEEIFIAPRDHELPIKTIYADSLPLKLEDFNLEVRIIKDSKGGTLSCPLEGDVFPLVIRQRRPGDTYLGKNLSDWFYRKKIRRWKRDYIPVFEKNGEILWVPGLPRKESPAKYFLEVVKINEQRFWIFDN